MDTSGGFHRVRIMLFAKSVPSRLLISSRASVFRGGGRTTIRDQYPGTAMTVYGYMKQYLKSCRDPRPDNILAFTFEGTRTHRMSHHQVL